VKIALEERPEFLATKKLLVVLHGDCIFLGVYLCNNRYRVEVFWIKVGG